MAYKKPQIVAKSAAKKQFVAGCPTNTNGSCIYRRNCQIDPTK